MNSNSTEYSHTHITVLSKAQQSYLIETTLEEKQGGRLEIKFKTIFKK